MSTVGKRTFLQESVELPQLEVFVSIHVRRPVMAFLQPLNGPNDSRIVVRPFTVDFVTRFRPSL